MLKQSVHPFLWNKGVKLEAKMQSLINQSYLFGRIDGEMIGVLSKEEKWLYKKQCRI